MTPLVSVLSLMLTGGPPPVRIGYGESRPYCYTGEDGKPAGFLVELFDEAARRDGQKLEWTRTGSSDDNTKALAAGSLDLLPMGLVNPERRRLLHVSEPWWSEDAILVVRADRRDVDIASPKRIALPGPVIAGAARHYPRSKPLVTTSAPEALEHLCRNTAEAALLGATFIRELVNSRPASCESVGLQVLDSPVTVDFSVISSRALKETADRLRERIAEMTADGTLTSIAARHPPISTPYTTRMAESLRARYGSQRMKIILVFLSAFLGVGLLLLARQLRVQRQLRMTIQRQRETEQQLRESQATLRQRTAELLRSNEDLQAFAYSVSHDLQEPLRNQSLYSELLERRHSEALPAEARRHLRVIRGSALRMQEMMRSLLAYSKLGQSDRQKQPVDCGEVVARVIRDLESLLARADARVEVGALPKVWAWEDRLQQVFQNLIENAAKYRKPNVPPAIQVAASKSGDGWLFSVADNGIGFSQEYADKIFGLFKRLHANDSYGGSGIGLAVCKRIVDRHGGRIWVESAEGIGTTFFFTIPAEAAIPTEPAGRETAQSI